MTTKPPNLNFKHLLVLLPLVYAIWLLGRTYVQPQLQNAEAQATVETVEVAPSPNPEDNLESYYQIYKDSYVVNLRSALNLYLEDPNKLNKSVTQSEKLGDNQSGLDSFQREYFESKFVVFDLSDNLAGGKNVQIIFQDKPDRIFNAWVYKLVGEKEEYELRSFYSRDDITAEQLEEINRNMAKFIFDKEHSI